MKIRQGFVSNSSTTSFCIMGGWVNSPEDCDDFWDMCESNGLECHSPEGYSRGGDYAVGLNFDDMGDDETKAQFIRRVKDLIFKLTGEDCDPGIIEEAYYS